MNLRTVPCLALLLFAPTLACSDDTDRNASSTTLDTSTSQPTGDGDPSGDGDADGDGDGDGDPSGDGDPTGGPEGSFCAHQCSEDADCLVDGMDLDLDCVDSFCLGQANQCVGDDECVALFSGWSTPCTAGGGECEASSQVCIPVLDGARCATPPSQFIECATLQMEELATTDVDGNPVTVCARTSAACHPDAYCFLPCQGNDDCASEAYPICNVASGLCECGQDSDCASLGLPGHSVCNAGVCGCGSDSDCVAAAYGDLCFDGACGCSGDAACEGFPTSFDGGSIQCTTF
jgi:hypothetical protein